MSSSSDSLDNSKCWIKCLLKYKSFSYFKFNFKSFICAGLISLDLLVTGLCGASKRLIIFFFYFASNLYFSNDKFGSYPRITNWDDNKDF